MREGQQVSRKIKEEKAQTPLVHPGSLPVPESEDPSALMGLEAGKQMAGLREKAGRGISRFNNKKKEDQGTERTQTMKKMRGGWEDTRGNGNKSIQASAILGMYCLFLHISTLMLLHPAGEGTPHMAAGGCAENVGQVEHASGCFSPTPATSSVRKGGMLN